MKDTIIVDKSNIEEAAYALENGGLVVFPTETVYGLGANIFDEKAIKGIYEAKGRPSDNPLIVHISDLSMLKDIAASVPDIAKKLMEKFWPGPVTFVLPKSEKVGGYITGGLDTVAVRMPSNEIALRLIKLAGVPVAAPSANISGRPSPTRESHVIEDMSGRVDYIIKGGDCEIGIESTVLDLTEEVPRILRPGFITKEDIESIVASVYIDEHLRDESNAPRSPGMKYTHYSPDADVVIIDAGRDAFTEFARGKLRENVGFIIFDDIELESDNVYSIGDRNNLSVAASRIFDALRTLDSRGVDVIYFEKVADDGIGMAVMNRMIKAAGYKIIGI